MGTLITSFDVWSHSLPFIEIYGTDGSLRLPDPNTFAGADEWRDTPLSPGYIDNSRGLGVADLATALRYSSLFSRNGAHVN
ncbi:MAG: hypothetical protein MI924_00905 [Chloroflexales bacterium]|nr:hypothetical protein [Chloroflexales bacterium]